MNKQFRAGTGDPITGDTDASGYATVTVYNETTETVTISSAIGLGGPRRDRDRQRDTSDPKELPDPPIASHHEAPPDRSSPRRPG